MESVSQVSPSPSSDRTTALASRLDQIGDPAWMRPTLERAIERLTGQPCRVNHSHVGYCKIKPHREIQVSLTAHLAGVHSADEPGQHFSMSFYPSQETGYEKFCEATRTPPSNFVTQRLEQSGYLLPAVYLPESAVIVRVFPVDEGLPELGRITTPESLLPLLAPDSADEPTALAGRFNYHVLHYKPGRSCTLHYRLNGTSSPNRETVGKIYRDHRGERCHGLLETSWQVAQQRGTWRAARPVGYEPRWNFVLQEMIAGRQFRHLFRELTPDDATTQQLAEVSRYLAAVAHALHDMQTATVQLPATAMLDFHKLLASQQNNLNHLSRTHTDLAKEIKRIRQELVRVEAASPPAEPVFCHGDFAHGNVLIDVDNNQAPVGIIDFDRAGLAEPAYDVAYFLTHLWSFGVRHPKRQPHIGPLCEFFRQAYLEIAPQVTLNRLALYEAFDFSAYVLRNFRKQSHQENWRAWARLQIEAAWQRLEVAAA